MWKPFFDRAYGKRPGEELYDLKADPDQIHNVAAEGAYQEIRQRLSKRLMDELTRTGDPRVTNDGDFFESPPLAGPPETTRGEENVTPEQLRSGKE